MKKMRTPEQMKRKRDCIGYVAGMLGSFTMLFDEHPLTAVFEDGRTVVFATVRAPKYEDYKTYSLNTGKVHSFEDFPAERKLFVIRFGGDGLPLYVPFEDIGDLVATMDRKAPRDHGGTVRRDKEPCIYIPRERFSLVKGLERL